MLLILVFFLFLLILTLPFFCPTPPFSCSCSFVFDLTLLLLVCVGGLLELYELLYMSCYIWQVFQAWDVQAKAVGIEWPGQYINFSHSLDIATPGDAAVIEADKAANRTVDRTVWKKVRF